MENKVKRSPLTRMLRQALCATDCRPSPLTPRCQCCISRQGLALSLFHFNFHFPATDINHNIEMWGEGQYTLPSLSWWDLWQAWQKQQRTHQVLGTKEQVRAQASQWDSKNSHLAQMWHFFSIHQCAHVKGENKTNQPTFREKSFSFYKRNCRSNTGL